MTINASRTKPKTRNDAATAAPAVDLAVDTLNEILNGKRRQLNGRAGCRDHVRRARLSGSGNQSGLSRNNVCHRVTSCGAPPEYESLPLSPETTPTSAWAAGSPVANSTTASRGHLHRVHERRRAAKQRSTPRVEQQPRPLEPRPSARPIMRPNDRNFWHRLAGSAKAEPDRGHDLCRQPLALPQSASQCGS